MNKNVMHSSFFAKYLMRWNGKVVNPLRPITAGVLDTSGVDSIWTKMVARDEAVFCLSHLPPAYTDLKLNMIFMTQYLKCVRN